MLIVLLLLIIVIAQNVQTVSTKILFVTINMPRAALLFIAVAVGFALGQVFSIDLKRRD
ncbi:MAG: LapA family protein [Candidatus Acetothermia bacterium]